MRRIFFGSGCFPLTQNRHKDPPLSRESTQRRGSDKRSTCLPPLLQVIHQTKDLGSASSSPASTSASVGQATHSVQSREAQCSAPPFVPSSMKRFFWNIRGFNGNNRKPTISDWIQLNKPILGGLLETHVKEENLNNIMTAITHGWRYD